MTSRFGIGMRVTEVDISLQAMSIWAELFGVEELPRVELGWVISLPTPDSHYKTKIGYWEHSLTVVRGDLDGPVIDDTVMTQLLVGVLT